ncbi:MAG: peptide ABC transporter permease [Actinomycetales bacterium]|nr:MAG: peptide ABC transporter permease [Actinomycetales bacterium]
MSSWAEAPAASGRRRRPRWTRSPMLLVGGAIVLMIMVVALLSLVWTPHDIGIIDADSTLETSSWEHWLGTDKYGRDVLTRIMVGSQTTLLVGIVAVGVATLIGVPAGILAAMLPRWWGELLMRGNDVLLAFPALLLAIMLTAVRGQGVVTAMIAIGIASAPSFARVVRSGAIGVMKTEYVLAARCAGRRPLAIALRHVLPNVSSLIIVQASIAFAIAVLAEAALSYLGLGAPPGTPSWGRMLQEGQVLIYVAPRLEVFPGVAIALAVLGFNLLGDGLRDFVDPRLRDIS